MTAELAEVRELLLQALQRLDHLEAAAAVSPAERRCEALRAAAEYLDPVGDLTAWGRAQRLAAAISTFDRRGDLRSGRRAPRDELEQMLVIAHRLGPLPASARQIHRLIA